MFEKGVELVYLPPYSPDLNPIEEFFAEINPSSSEIGNCMSKTLVKAFVISWFRYREPEIAVEIALAGAIASLVAFQQWGFY